jgi:hypothetical protein
MPQRRKKSRCGKRVYYSLDEATKVVLRAWREQKLPLRTYFCHRCGGYHLTSKEYGYPG